jgi:hypothetical protein
MAAADHLKSNPAVIVPQVVTDSPVSIERFFTGAPRFNPTVPRLTDAELLGARLCHLDGETAELIFLSTSWAEHLGVRDRGAASRARLYKESRPHRLSRRAQRARNLRRV